jgi:hypothetical protein
MQSVVEFSHKPFWLRFPMQKAISGSNAPRGKPFLGALLDLRLGTTALFAFNSGSSTAQRSHACFTQPEIRSRLMPNSRAAPNRFSYNVPFRREDARILAPKVCFGGLGQISLYHGEFALPALYDLPSSSNMNARSQISAVPGRASVIIHHTGEVKTKVIATRINYWPVSALLSPHVLRSMIRALCSQRLLSVRSSGP